MWLLTAVAVVGAVGVTSRILKKLNDSAGKQRQRWQSEYKKTQQEVQYYNQQIQRKVQEAQWTVDFHQLTQLHFNSMKTADHAYSLLADARKCLDEIGLAIRDAGKEKNRLIAQKKNTYDYQTKHNLQQEIDMLVQLRNHLFPDKDQLKLERDEFQRQVKEFNAKTHNLKLTIRDRCGERGLDWYQRLEGRTQRRNLGLPAQIEEKVITGRVKWFNSSKGFGFITPDLGGQDVHVSARNLENVRSLSEGDKVEFVLKFNNKGRRADKVNKVSKFLGLF